MKRPILFSSNRPKNFLPSVTPAVMVRHMALFTLLMGMIALMMLPPTLSFSVESKSPLIAKVRKLDGEVWIKYHDSGRTIAISKGEEVVIEKNDTIITLFKGVALIAIYDTENLVKNKKMELSAQVRLSPNTQFTLNQMNFNDAVMKLEKGKVQVTITGNTKTNFSVSSPIATAGVRGTKFEFAINNDDAEAKDSTSDQSVKVEVYYGEVLVELTKEEGVAETAEDQAKKRTLKTGQAATVIKGKGIYITTLPTASSNGMGCGEGIIQYF